MRCRWPVIIGGFAVFCVIAGPVLSAPEPGRSVETETIIVPPEEPGPGVSGPTVPDSLKTDDIEPDEDAVEADSETYETDAPYEVPTVEYDTSKLPPPVRRLREQIREAATSGDIERLRLIFDANDGPPAITFNEPGDPIKQLLSLSGDPEGREVLAILIEVLDAGYVHVDVGTPEEMYVWPYFARYPLDKLSGPQMVELFKLLTAGDYEDMKIYGTYLFYRVGIAPNGVWRFFLAGD